MLPFMSAMLPFIYWKGAMPLWTIVTSNSNPPGFCDWLNAFITIILGIHTYDVINAW